MLVPGQTKQVDKRGRDLALGTDFKHFYGQIEWENFRLVKLPK